MCSHVCDLLLRSALYLTQRYALHPVCGGAGLLTIMPTHKHTPAEDTSCVHIWKAYFVEVSLSFLGHSSRQCFMKRHEMLKPLKMFFPLSSGMNHESNKSPSLGMISTATRTTATVSPLSPLTNGNVAQSANSGFAAALRKLAKQAEDPRGEWCSDRLSRDKTAPTHQMANKFF